MSKRDISVFVTLAKMASGRDNWVVRVYEMSCCVQFFLPVEALHISAFLNLAAAGIWLFDTP